MHFINKTGNTVYLEDIDTSIPYANNEVQFLNSEKIKRSKSFQKLVSMNMFEIIDTDDSRIEKNLKRISQDYAKLKQDSPIVNKTEQPVDISVDVRIRGHFYEAGGYAKVNRNLATGLASLGVNVAIDPISITPNDLTDFEMQQLSSLKKTASKNCIFIDSIIPTFGQMSYGKYSILYTTVESSTVPQQFVDVAKMYNEIWVTSDFCKQVLEKYIQKPIFVMPDTINTDMYCEQGDEYEFRPKLKDFVFLSVFGWSYRKGYDVLLKSYLQEFTGNDNVTLLLASRCQAGKKDTIKDAVMQFIKNYGGSNPPHISRCSRVIPESQMPSLYRACNAFVLFSRGEGYGLIYPEASLCGLPIIATNYSGHTMFLNKDNSYLLDIDQLVKVQPGTMNIHYWDSQMFPSLTSEEVIKNGRKLLREVYSNYNEAKAKNKLLQKFITENYNIQNICQKIKSRLEEIKRKTKW